MSTHSFPKIDQKEYLKKYLSGDKVKKTKKDKKQKKSSAASVKVKIIDDDINHLDTGVEIDEELLLTGDDAPQIVGEYIEENPAERKVPKWKSIVIKDEPDDDSEMAKQNEEDLWGHKSDDVRVKQEYSAGKTRSSKTPIDSSQSTRSERKRKSSLSPPRRHRKSQSPPRNHMRDESSSKYRKKEMSPDRRVQIKTEPQSPQHIRRNGNPPQRQNEREYSFETISPRRGRRNSDQSPPRRGKSPVQKTKSRSTYHSPSESDNSPPRRKRNSLRRDSDQSPPRKNYISDQSPPRRRRKSDQSPPRRVKRRDSDRIRNAGQKADFSPARKVKRRDSDRIRNAGQKADFSPARKVRRSPDRSPPNRRRNSDQSPPRRKNRNSPSKHKQRSPDQSPLRRRKNSPPPYTKQEKRTPDLSPQLRRSRWEKQELDRSLSPPPTHKPKPGKTLEGKKAGLQDAKALQKETMERRKQEDLLFKKMSSDVSGRDAEVQVRSTGRKGRRAREAAEEDSKERRRKEEHEEKKKLLYERWGKGLKQIEDHKNRMLEQQYESSKPLARYSNDEDLERHLKEKERLEDPMLEYMRQKRKEKEKQSGKPQIPRYEGPYPENRFGIRPGYRWDGVDRSNGYEKRYFAAMNEKKAQQDEAYKYSVEDM